MSDTLTSAEFRKQYARLDRLTRVQVNGHTIGYWVPIEDVGQPHAILPKEGIVTYDIASIHEAADRAMGAKPQTPQQKRDAILRRINEGG